MAPEKHELVIVGAGPAGLAAASQAHANGLDYVLLERADHLADTIFCYQKRKHVMAEPSQIPARSGVPFAVGSREAILAGWNRHSEETGLKVKLRAELQGLERGGAGFLVRTSSGEIEAARVVLAIGTQGTPRGLGAPGEDLPHVAMRLVDPDDFVDRSIVVVGAGDSALEVAFCLCERNRVYLVVRRPEIVRAKEALLKELAKRSASGQLEVLYSTTVRRVLPTTIELKGAQQDSTVQCDQVFLKIGTQLPRSLIEGFGVEFASPDDDARPVLSGSYQSSVPGLYLIGAVTGRDLIRLCMNQGFEVVEHILGRPVEQADEEILKRKLPFWNGTVQQRILDLMDEVPLIGSAATRSAPAGALGSGGSVRREPIADQLREFLLSAEPRTFQDGEVILRQDEYTQSVMLLIDGSVEVQRREDSGAENKLALLSAGSFFGEMGLISGRRRNASCLAVGETKVLEVPRKTMLRFLSSAAAAKRMMDSSFLVRSLRNYFPPEIPVEALWRLVGVAKTVPFEKDQVVFREQDPGDGMYLIRSGQVKLTKRSGDRDLVLTYLVAGMFLGERALLGNDPRPVTATTIFPSELVKLSRADLDAFLGRFPGLRPILERRLVAQRMATLQEEATPGAGVVLSELIRENVVMGTDALLIDENKCIRCSNCVRACEDAHDDGQARLSLTGVKFANVLAPNSCWQCEDPLCMLDCPPDALYRDARGEIHVRDNCIGCGNCESNCPYGNIFMVHPKGEQNFLGWVKSLLGGQKPVASSRTVAVKCDLCSSLPTGPACVRGCPTGAAIRVQPADYQATVARLMRVGVELMFLLTPESARWRWITVLLSLVLVGAYWLTSRGGFAHGGSITGLTFGVLALGLLVFLLFFSVRKRWHRGAPGRLESWAQAHVYLGLLVVLAVVLHSGFRFQDRVAIAAFAVMGAVVASGLLGAVLYTVVPFLLTGAESNVPPPELAAQLNQQAQIMTRLVTDRSAALQEICRRVIEGAHPAALAGWRVIFFPPRAATQGAPSAWSALLSEVPPAETAQLDQLLVQVRQFQELHRSLVHQQRYRNLLAAWLYVHIPLSAALVALVVAHIVAVFYYRSI